MSGHPWIYHDDVASVEAEPGDLVPVFDPNEKAVGWGLFSSHSKITLRMVTASPEQPDRAFWLERVRTAVEARGRMGLLEPAGACRLLSGDAEGVPGLIVDRYADVLVLQCGTQSADRMRDFLLELVLEVLPLEVGAVLDRSDTGVRRLEDLEKRTVWLRGAERESIVVEEPGLSYEVDPLHGHKTGHYLDQRQNRVRAAENVAGDRVLDVFCYDGLFGIRAALAGASEVLCLDQSAGAGERLLRNAERNGVADRVRFEKVDAMGDLRRRASEAETWDTVVLDPPAFARNRRELEGAERGYRELNLRALGLVRPGGRLVSCSCSYNVTREAFAGYLARAASDAGRATYLEHYAGAAPDHPWRVSLPESSYLKAAFLRVEA